MKYFQPVVKKNNYRHYKVDWNIMKDASNLTLSPSSSSNTAKGFFLMLGSAFLFAVLGVLIKLLGPDYRVWDIAIFRFGGGVIVLYGLFGWQQNLIKPRNPKMMLFRGLTGSCAFIALVLAIRHIPLSTTMVLFYSYPAFAAMFSPLLFGDRISGGEVISIGLAIIGVAVLLDFRFEGGVFGQLMALTSAVFAGLTVALIKKLRETHGSVIIYFYFCVIGTAISIGPFSINPQLPRVGLEWLIVGGILFTSILAQLLMNQGFRYCKSWEGGLFMTSELIFVTIFGILFLGEPMTWRFWTGGVLILSSAVGFNYLKKSAWK